MTTKASHLELIVNHEVDRQRLVAIRRDPGIGTFSVTAWSASGVHKILGELLEPDEARALAREVTQDPASLYFGAPIRWIGVYG